MTAGNGGDRMRFAGRSNILGFIVSLILVPGCPRTPAPAAVDSDGRPLGDVDNDCDNDLWDFLLFQTGVTGPLN